MSGDKKEMDRPEESPAVDEVPVPTIEGLSQRSQRGLLALAQAQASGGSMAGDLLEETLESVKSDLDGQALGLLEETLDWLRESGLYEVSIPLLEEAWSSDLPLDFQGRVAQDWIGSILFGLGDEKGAREVARHLTKRAQELGATFCSDLCDMWLEWGFFAEAESIVRFVHDKMPGESSALFHLMICAKMRLDWIEASSWLTQLDQRRVMSGAEGSDPAIEWNRGLIAVAQRNWGDARAAWQEVGFSFPETDEGQEPSQDYAMPGELSPVRLKIDLEIVEASEGRLPRSEVVWGRRIGPARVELTGIPYFHPQYKSGDTLLVDGVQEGKVDFNGETYPVSPVLDVWSPSPGETIKFYGEQETLKQGITLDRFVQELGERGWAIVHWTRMVRRETSAGKPLLQVALYLPPDRQAQAFNELLTAFSSAEGTPRLYSPRFAHLVGEPVKPHRQMWEALGVRDESHDEVKH